MDVRLPQHLPECDQPARQFCATCRDRDGGRAFRQAILQVRGIDGVSGDFDCPRGLPWHDGDATNTRVGDRFAAALHNRLGGIPCGACQQEQRRLNTLAAEQVKAERTEIIEATVKRAKNLPRWRDRIKAKLGDAVAPEQLRRIIGECLDLSLEQEQA